MFKIALNAGHYMYEAGRRVWKRFDNDETREWVLNARICDKVTELLKDYEGYSLLRVDDPTGQSLIKLADRAKKVNDFDADIYVSVHHNGGIYGGTGGGIMAYTYPYVDDTTRRLQKMLYDKLIEHTGLSGNRATPLAVADFAECRLTKMPAVLLECGFMDSATDAPKIITEQFSLAAATAITEAIVAFADLKKKTEVSDDLLYRVQVGAYKNRKNAEIIAEELKKYGFDAIIKTEKA